MQILLGGLYAAMPKHFRHVIEVRVVRKEVGCKGVPQGVGMDFKAGLLSYSAEGILHRPGCNAFARIA